MDVVPLNSETVTLPRSFLKPGMILAALDSGSTLLKMAFVDKDENLSGETVTFHIHMYNNKDIAAVLQLIKSRVLISKENGKLNMTGVGYGTFKDLVEKTLDVDTVYVDELFGVVHASQILLKFKTEEEVFYPNPPNTRDYKVDVAPWLKEESQRMGVRMTANDHLDNKPPMNFLNFGSSVMVVHVDEDGKIIPKSIPLIGGLPFIGISKLWLGSSDYEEIMNLAEKGDVSKCYWIMKDCVPDGAEYGEKDADFPLFAFGRAFYEPDKEYSREDIAAALVSFFAQIAHTVTAHVSETTGISRFYVTGNWARSETARRILSEQRSVMHANVIEYKFFRCNMLSVFGILLSSIE